MSIYTDKNWVSVNKNCVSGKRGLHGLKYHMMCHMILMGSAKGAHICRK